LAFLDRPLNPEKGKQLYLVKCNKCHQTNGQGTMNNTETDLYIHRFGVQNRIILELAYTE